MDVTRATESRRKYMIISEDVGKTSDKVQYLTIIFFLKK